MALKTLGTNATTSLSGFIVGFNDTIPADVATLNTQLRDDPPAFAAGYPFPKVGTTGLIIQAGSVGTTRSRINQAYVQTGLLIIPNRGRLRLQSGDFVCWDTTTGWPIVISGDAAANGPYTHT
jgi:hypothetical protein